MSYLAKTKFTTSKLILLKIQCQLLNSRSQVRICLIKLLLIFTELTFWKSTFLIQNCIFFLLPFWLVYILSIILHVSFIIQYLVIFCWFEELSRGLVSHLNRENNSEFSLWRFYLFIIILRMIVWCALVYALVSCPWTITLFDRPSKQFTIILHRTILTRPWDFW